MRETDQEKDKMDDSYVCAVHTVLRMRKRRIFPFTVSTTKILDSDGFEGKINHL